MKHKNNKLNDFVDVDIPSFERLCAHMLQRTAPVNISAATTYLNNALGGYGPLPGVISGCVDRHFAAA